MKKKLAAAIILVGVIAAFLLLAGPVTFNIQKQVLVNASLYDISKQFTDLRNWQRWYEPLKETKDSINFSASANALNASAEWNNNSLTTMTYNPAAVRVRQVLDNKTSYQSISGVATDYGRSTIVYWATKGSGWQWLKENMFGNSSIEKELNNLKAVCENATVEYGFSIAIEPVKDTIILTKKMNVAVKQQLTKQHLLYDELKGFMKDQHVAPTRNYIFVSALSLGTIDSITIAVGMPVNKKGVDKDGMQFLELPSRGRLLTGKYDGGYAGIKKLYAAMDRYVKDKGLQIVAQQMEEHTGFDILQNDSTNISVRLIYPIY